MAENPAPTPQPSGSAPQQPIVAPPVSTIPKKIPKYPKKYWDNVWLFSIFAVIFWGLEFCYQYFLYPESTGNIEISLVRSFALTGATFFASALFSSAIFKWVPRTAIHWHLRRHFGVSAFVCLLLHAIFVDWFYFAFDLKTIYSSLNPVENPLVFGTLALPILFVMAVTSTEWMINKLTPKVWKFIHRFVYLAFIFALFHIALVNPVLLNSPPGYLLVLLLAAAAFGELYWFFRIASKRHFRSWGSLVGFSLIAFALALLIWVLLTYKT